MPQRVMISLLMLFTICLGILIILLIQRASRERFPPVIWSCAKIALVTMMIFTGIDVACYLLGYWPLSKMLHTGKYIISRGILLVVMIRLVIFISTYKPSSEPINDAKD